MVETVNYLEETRDLLPDGSEILGFVVGPQGFATQPNGLVLYRDGDGYENYKVHTVLFETRGLVTGGYWATLKDAWVDFYLRMSSMEGYVGRGIPLTGER